MKKTAVKIICLCLCALMLLPIFASCKKDGAGGESTDAPSLLQDSAYDENQFVLDDLGNDLNFNNAEVSFLCWKDRSEQEFDSDGQGGNKIDEVIFKRNLAVQERLKVTLVYDLETRGNYDHRQEYIEKVENDRMSGLAEYDIYASYGPLGSTFAQRGYVADMSKLDYLNFSKPWWPENIVSELTIDGKLYFATGDISTNLLWMMHGTFVNTSMLSVLQKTDPLKAEEPTKLVKEGRWTLAKLQEMSKNVWKDSAGEGNKTVDDTYGFAIHKNVIESLVIGSDIKAVEKNNKDLPVISSKYESQKMSDVIDILGEWLNDSQDVWMNEAYADARAIFAQGRSLFITDKTYIVSHGLEDMEDKYILLPMPKYDENQADYKTDVGNPHTVYSIAGADETVMNICAAVIECSASESYRRVMPQLFEETLKIRYSESAEAGEMFDIMRRTITFDLGKVFTLVIGRDGCEIYKDVIYKGQGGWSSTFKSVRGSLTEKLEDISEDFIKNSQK